MNSSGKLGAIFNSRWMRFCNACWLTKGKLDSHSLSIDVCEQARFICPAPILATSRMSLIKDNRWLPLLAMVSNGSFCSWLTAPNIFSSIASDIPKMALSGVRNSWLMLARNSSLRRVARASSLLEMASCWLVSFSCDSACCFSVNSFWICSNRLACWMAIASWLAICWTNSISGSCQARGSWHWWIQSSPHRSSPFSNGTTRLARIWKLSKSSR